MQEKYIDLSLKEAQKAYKKNEVPVGAIIVRNGKVIAKAHNMVEKKKNATLHAEIIAITKASKKLKNWRLYDCEMYVTLEPCFMCKSAIELSRIKKVYYFVKRDKEIKFNNKYKFLETNNCDFLKIIQDFFAKKR